MKHLGKMLILVLAVALLCGLLCACKKDLPTGETGLPDTGNAAGAGDNAAGTEGNGTGPNENPGGNKGTPGENDGNGGGNTGGNGGGNGGSTVPSNPGKDTDIVLPEIPFHKK